MAEANTFIGKTAVLEGLAGNPAVMAVLAWNPEALLDAKFDRDELTLTIAAGQIRAAAATVLGVLRELYASGAAPGALAGWHYDEVHRCFRDGGAAMVPDWPGYYGSYRSAGSAVRDRFRVARMPACPSGRVCCYAGS